MKEIIIIGLIISVFLLCGCVDRSGYEECFDSYDNLILKEGWKITSHSSDFVTSAENRYFVTFQIHNWTSEKTKYVCGFVYNSEDDELIYSPDGFTPELPEEVLDYF